LGQLRCFYFGEIFDARIKRVVFKTFGFFVTVCTDVLDRHESGLRIKIESTRYPDQSQNGSDKS